MTGMRQHYQLSPRRAAAEAVFAQSLMDCGGIAQCANRPTAHTRVLVDALALDLVQGWLMTIVHMISYVSRIWRM